jgi:acetyl esterase/lipase
VFPDHLVDVKRVIAWVKVHAADYGGDPDDVFIAGSSAGAHLAATASLTPNDARFQPGFEDTDTSVVGTICLYGYYGPISTAGLPSSPHDYVNADAPSMAVVHGDRDTIVIVDDAAAFARDLREHSTNPVVYAALPGGQHNFDLVHSIRFEAVVDAVERFTTAVALSRQAPGA